MMDENTNTKKIPKTQKTRRETAVQGTNDNSVVSKNSMAAAGYVEDNFLKFFVAKTSRRASLIHWGYYIRAKTVNSIVTNFLQRYSSTYKQIISLGSGFDSTYFRLKSSGHLNNSAFVEVDFPEVVKRKHIIIQSTGELRDLLGDVQTPQAASPHIELNCVDFKMLGVDLTRLNTLEAALRLCHVDFEAPTLILSECVLTYMTRRCSSAVVKWSAETFSDSVFVLYEQIHPNDPFGLFMQNHYHVIGSPLKCINSFPTLESQKARFMSLGWTWCEGYDMNQFYQHLISTEEKQHISSLEPFDEYEEWHLKCAHYFVLCAYSSQCQGLLGGGGQPSADKLVNCSESVNDLVKVLPWTQTFSLKRFSHTSTRLNNANVVTIGGFGEQDGRHQRISDVHIHDILDPQTKKCVIKIGNSDSEMSRMHHSVDVLDDNSLLVFGGRNSPFRLCTTMVSLTFSEQASVGTESPVTLTANSLTDDSESSLTNCDTSCDMGVNTAVSNSHQENNSTPKSSDKCDGQVAGITDESKSKSDQNGDCCDGEKDLTVNLQQNDAVTSELNLNMDLKVISQTGDIPCLRWRHATTRVCIAGKESVYLYGGRSSSEPSLSDAYLYDPKTFCWSQVQCEGEVPGCRQSHTLSVWGQEVILVGGLDELMLPKNSVHCLDLTSRTWRRLAVKGSLQPRYSHTAHVINNILVVIGGVNLSQGTPGVALIDLSTGRSQEYALPPSQKECLMMVHKHSSVSLADGQFMIIGGGGNCFSFGSHLNVSPFILDIRLCLQNFTKTV